MLSGRGLCDELITRPEESCRLRCVVVCDLETSRIGAPYIYDISSLRVKLLCSLPRTPSPPSTSMSLQQYACKEMTSQDIGFACTHSFFVSSHYKGLTAVAFPSSSSFPRDFTKPRSVLAAAFNYCNFVTARRE